LWFIFYAIYCNICYRAAISRTGEAATKVSRADNSKKRKEVTELSLYHIHGYRGFDGRNNLHFINDGVDIVYHAAGAGIVQNINSGELPGVYFS